MATFDETARQACKVSGAGLIWWLERFAYGPIEWLWRALMYGRRPTFRRAGPVGA